MKHHLQSNKININKILLMFKLFPMQFHKLPYLYQFTELLLLYFNKDQFIIRSNHYQQYKNQQKTDLIFY